jgi:hypothetical protein
MMMNLFVLFFLTMYTQLEMFHHYGLLLAADLARCVYKRA